ncbi:hypothetical protein [Cognatitamlana onchidii]|uniref:hypothetical protein n=1 Tax=Cognatitamlana onchidii TaxID=2562860 RepID=UPI0010A5FF95|nr:hypothetical protein [Algibacter onchidii]
MKKIITLLLVMLFMSCDEDNIKDNVETADPTATIEALNEYVLVNRIFQDVGNNNGDAVLSAETSVNTNKKTSTKDEPTITVTPFDLNTFPKTIVIDFKSGILCKDGVTRKGVITVVSTNWYGQEGSEHTATFDNYYHNDYLVEGTHFVKNLGKNNNDELRYAVTIKNGKITTAEDEVITYTEDSFRTWVAGSNTPINIWDDEYELEGTQNGVNSKGIDYTLSVKEPLHFVLLPRSIKSGILNIDIGKIKDIELNYNNSTVTILGVEYPILVK